mgnify:CR=1 FL=1
MAEYQLGKQRTKARQRTTVMINLSLKRPVYDRLVAMAQALQQEIGPYHHVTVGSMVRRILYQHPALRSLVARDEGADSPTSGDARRCYEQPADGGDSLVR